MEKRHQTELAEEYQGATGREHHQASAGIQDGHGSNDAFIKTAIKDTGISIICPCAHAQAS